MTIPWPFILFDGCLGGAIAALVDKMLLVSLRAAVHGDWIWDGTCISVKAGALDRGHKSSGVG